MTMRKIFVCLIFVCALLAISSCSSNEGKVKTVFKDYVESNFNDPNDLVEIVSVDSCDTISSKDMKSLLKEAKHKYDSIKVEFRKVSENITSIPAGTIRDLGYENPDFMDVCTTYRTDLEKSIENDGTFALLLANALEGGEPENITLPSKRYEKIMSTKDNIVYQYTIKARVKDNGSVKLKKYYAICDTTLTNIKISQRKTTIGDLMGKSDAEETIDLTSMYAESYTSYAVVVEEGKTILSYIRLHNK